MPAFGPLVVSALCPVPLVERTPATIHVVERGRRGTGHETPRRVLPGSGGEAGERTISRLRGWGPLEKVELECDGLEAERTETRVGDLASILEKWMAASIPGSRGCGSCYPRAW